MGMLLISTFSTWDSLGAQEFRNSSLREKGHIGQRAYCYCHGVVRKDQFQTKGQWWLRVCLHLGSQIKRQLQRSVLRSTELYPCISLEMDTALIRLPWRNIPLLRQSQFSRGRSKKECQARPFWLHARPPLTAYQK